MSQSPHVTQLLSGLGDKQEGDYEALVVLAARSVATLRPTPRAVEMRGQPLFVLGVRELTMVLRNTGFGAWFTSTWLRLNADGSVTSDKPAVDAFCITDHVYARLTDRTMSQMAASADVTTVHIDGLAVYAMNPRGLAEFLSVARATAQESWEWQAYAFKSHLEAAAIANRLDSPQNSRKLRP